MNFRGLSRAPLYTGQPDATPAYVLRGNRIVAVARRNGESWVKMGKDGYGLGQTSSDIQSQIIAAATQYGVDPNLALAVANQESGFNQSAVGTSGEIGVFQLMPGTASDLGVNPSVLSENIQGGVQYLAEMLNQNGGNTSLALAAYNAGQGTVNSGTIPASTQNYVSSILAALPAGSAPSGGVVASVAPSVSTDWVPWAVGAGLLAAVVWFS